MSCKNKDSLPNIQDLLQSNEGVRGSKTRWIVRWLLQLHDRYIGDYCDILFTLDLFKNFHSVIDFQFLTPWSNIFKCACPVLFVHSSHSTRHSVHLLRYWTRPKDLLWPMECEWTWHRVSKQGLSICLHGLPWPLTFPPSAVWRGHPG